MKKTWHNNRISKKLNEEYEKDFSIMDIDGFVKCWYRIGTYWAKPRIIYYESKNENESLGDSQLKSLKFIQENFNWQNCDHNSGVFIITIIDLESELLWEDVYGNIIRTTTFQELYEIFSAKDMIPCPV